MNDFLYFSITLLFGAVGYYYSWRFQAKGNFKVALLLLMLCGLLLRLYTSMDFYLHTWDERYHALVAKNLISHPLKPTLYDTPIFPYNYTDWIANHIWVHKQPLPLWTMALSLRIFGVNEIALRLPSILFTTLGIGLTFSIAKFFFSPRVAYLSAFLYSINGLILELTAGKVATDHIDIFFLFFIELAVYFSILFVQKQKMLYNILVGFSIGAAILSKWLPALIVLPIWLLLVIDSKKFKPTQIAVQFFVLLATCFLIFLPWQLYIFHVFPAEARWEASFNLKHMTEVLEEQTGPFYYFVERIRINYGDLIYLPLIWFTWQTLKTKDKKRMALLVWFYVPLIFFSCIKTKMQAYILFTCPVLFMVTADFWYMLADYRTRHTFKWLYSLVLLLLIALPIRYTFECLKRFSDVDRNPQWVQNLKSLHKKQILNGVLFNCSHPIEAMFYTNLTVYPYIPDKAVIEDLMAKGHTVYINDKGNIPAEIKAIHGVKTEKLTP